MRHILPAAFRTLCKKLKKTGKAKRSAQEHNKLGNVDTLNLSKAYWLRSRDSDRKFIDSIYKDVLRLTAIENGLRIADVGCGTGVLVDRLKKDFTASEIKGYDFSRAKIEQCQAYYGYDNEVFAVHNIYENLQEDWDILIATEVLEHLEYPGYALETLIKSLKPKGRLFVTVPDGREDSFHGHIHFWSPESWRLFLEDFEGEYIRIEAGCLKDKNYALMQKQ